MIDVSFKAKVVRDPETRDTKLGTVCNLRVRQIDPGKPSLFMDVAAFGEELAKTCQALAKGATVDLSGGLIYTEWTAKPKGSGKPQKRSKHSVIVESVVAA